MNGTARAAWCALGLAPLMLSCAEGRGAGFARLEEATLEVGLEAGEAGTIVTATGYEVTVQHATTRIEHVELQEIERDAAGDSHATAPDADACHSDHCHEERANAEHAEPEVEATNGVEAYSTLVELGFDEPVSLTTHRAVAAHRYEPSRVLGRSTPRRVVVVLERLEIEASVSQGARSLLSQSI